MTRHACAIAWIVVADAASRLALESMLIALFKPAINADATARLKRRPAEATPYKKITLRLPVTLLDRLQQEAAEELRTLNGQIVHVLCQRRVC